MVATLPVCLSSPSQRVSERKQLGSTFFRKTVVRRALRRRPDFETGF